MLRLKDYPKNEQLAKECSIEANCKILMTIFQSRALSSDKPATHIHKGFKNISLFITLH